MKGKGVLTPEMCVQVEENEWSKFFESLASAEKIEFVHFHSQNLM
jgi:hypothetical protein